MEEFVQTDEHSILQVNLSLINYCARTGYALNQWQSIVTKTIPKETGNFKLHRLRVIHLYEADLTALFSIWSRKMIQNSEQKQTINPGSFGARPGCMSTDPPYIQVLQTEIVTLSRSSLANCPNDATQCYDRILPNHPCALLPHMAMPPSAATCSDPPCNKRDTTYGLPFLKPKNTGPTDLEILSLVQDKDLRSPQVWAQ